MSPWFDHRRGILLGALASVACFANGSPIAIADDSPADSDRIGFFEKRIRPILVDHCYECHGPDEASGRLRLDTKAGWERGGESGPAIVPGQPAASLLMRAISYRDTGLKMPPPDSGGKLTERQIRDLSVWIRQGALDPRTGDGVVTDIEAAARDHWAFQPVAPPQVDSDRNPIDVLIDRKLTGEGFVATEPADLRTLIRRATFDLLGLPPTSEQLSTPRDGFPHLVRELLDSPRYGERWGRHWLDVARYSDAKDGVLMYGDARVRPFAYTYRDYVIRAFNDDKPFDRFIREQLAADQMGLPEDSPDLAAMGLLTLGRMFDRNRHDVIDDQIDVITRGFQGLTVSCARCHDHKFDPVPTADYYSLYGVFASSQEPLERPRIESVADVGMDFESEFGGKLREVYAKRQKHYDEVLQIARDRAPDYLAQVVTTEPDLSETTILFLSLIPDQLRPQITWRWRQLIARRAFPDDPVFGPWHDLMEQPKLTPAEWRQRGVDQRIIDGLVAAKPKTPEQIARTYGEIIRSVWKQEDDLKTELAAIETQRAILDGSTINLADIVAGGNGFGSGKRGNGIHPGTGAATSGGTGFITIEKHDLLIPVPENPFVDGVFVPKTGEASISTTGLTVTDIPPSSGQTWDYFKFGPSSGSTANTIDGVDYSLPPHSMLSLHANKGITFDVQAMRDRYSFAGSRFQGLFGHSGAKNESRLDVYVYLDGQRMLEQRDYAAQQKGLELDIVIPPKTRFLTLVVTEGGQGISHDQAVIGNPRIMIDRTEAPTDDKRRRLAELDRQERTLKSQLAALSLEDDPLGALLVSRSGPVWFPIEDVARYLDRQPSDAFRGLVKQLDAIAVRHRTAAARAMVLVDSDVLCDPVIFQRGDPGARGNPVPRQFLEAVSGPQRRPFPNGSGRLDLANAIASPDNPLTARVWANRVWMHHFGEPLVDNPSDFGLRTKRPVHHALLEYLADFFVDNGWRTKPLHELIMSSRAYQRASRIPEDDRMARQLQDDPDNRLIWHANRRRLDLEQMRDSILAVSGRLDDTMYGRPPLITDANNTRRTVYAFVERQNIPSIVQTFDFANADSSTSRRVTTTVPQQALFAMNSTFMTQAAKALVGRVGEGSDTDRIRTIYRIAIGRAPDDDEVVLAQAFVSMEAWEQFAQVLLMSNEMMFVD